MDEDTTPSGEAPTVHDSSRATAAPAGIERLHGPRFRQQGTLGQGGMAIVRLAEQRSLGRQVAIKSLRSDAPAGDSTRALLQEAWITGALQHPNIVPVHDIDLDDEGRPRIVLKRIEGEPWSLLMHEPELIRRRFRATDPLEWNLRVLIEVLQAVHFAHVRGFVHRDLKPDNIMVGSFGEVYVVDWGLAVATDDDGTGRFPLAADADQTAGTLSYMAPEQLGGAQAGVTPRTDVYLAGSILYEILSSSPPHVGDTPMELIRAISLAPRPLPEEVDAELSSIALRALDPDPEVRFESAEHLRLALEGFLAHRNSQRLLQLAEEHHAQMREAIVRDDTKEAEFEYRQVMFGCRAALEIWDGNEAARALSDEASIAMVERSLALDDHSAAQRILDAMRDVPEELVARVESLRARTEARRRALEQLARETSLRPGQPARLAFALILGALWTIVPIGGRLTGLDAGLTPIRLMGTTAAYLAVVVALIAWNRRTMLLTQINRALSGMLVVTLLAQLAWIAGATQMGMGLDAVRATFPLIYAVAAAGAAAAAGASRVVQKVLMPVPVLYVITFLACAQMPEQVPLITGGANGLAFVYAVVLNAGRHRSEPK
ncbi:MAG: serine/threonine-protein kinase [Myxococcota bacterium]